MLAAHQHRKPRVSKYHFLSEKALTHLADHIACPQGAVTEVSLRSQMSGLELALGPESSSVYSHLWDSADIHHAPHCKVRRCDTESSVTFLSQEMGMMSL